jgi:hypothetical protein
MVVVRPITIWTYDNDFVAQTSAVAEISLPIISHEYFKYWNRWECAGPPTIAKQSWCEWMIDPFNS